MAKFTWGQVIRRFTVDMDGDEIEVVKYHPWKSTEGGMILGGQPNQKQIQFHVDELRESFNSMQSLMIAWIAYKNLGLNQHTLVAGLCRALDIDKVEEKLVVARERYGIEN